MKRFLLRATPVLLVLALCTTGLSLAQNTAPGALDLPGGTRYNDTHWQAQVGSLVTAFIRGATDVSGNSVSVIIKSSNFGNQTVTGTRVGTSNDFQFSFTVPATGWCQTSIVAYKTNGNNANNSIITPGGNSAAGFAIVDAGGSLVATCITCTPPSITPPQGSDLGCNPSILPDDASVLAATTVSGTSPSVSVLHSDATSGCVVTRTFTVTATNACGSDSKQVVYSWTADKTPPSFTFVPQEGTVECPNSPSFGDATATDECGSVTMGYTDSRTARCGNTYSITRTWTATDACGNSATASATINVVDTTPPAFTFVPEGGKIECPGTPSFGDAAASDACGSVTVTFADVRTAGCGNTYSVTRTWTATDACGNSATASATINVVDTTPPTISAAGASGTIECPAAPVFTAPTASDACGTADVVLVSDVRTPGCGNSYSETKTWKAVDACGNESGTVSQTISVEDHTAPAFTFVPAGGTIECPNAPSFGDAAASDACSDVAISFADARTTGCGNTYSITRTWTATDACGNSATASATINVVDTTPPTISAAGASGTIECPAAPVFTAPTASDVCGDPRVEVVSDVTTPGCGHSYSRTITWRAVDACGNASASVSQTISVEDHTAPAFTFVPAGGTIECPNAPSFGDAAASDACSDVAISFADVTTPGCGNAYRITRTWTATDACGNSATASATISVEDHTAPVITHHANISLDGCAQNVTYEVAASDACSGVTVALDPASGSLFPIGETTVHVTATDACGNKSEDSFTVTIRAHILVTKFYDANANGQRDAGEAGIANWPFTIDNTGYVTGPDGSADIAVTSSGPHAVAEVFPSQNWMATTARSYSFECGGTATFGNVCFGAGGGLTLGFWSNKNGEKAMNDGGSAAPELAMLSGLNLRNANGSAFDPGSYTAFRTWILSATATNMAYMLSAQLAAMELNVEAGYVNGSSIVYQSGVGFVSITNLMAAADAALAANGLVLDGNPNRASMEALKNALDNANNNRNFVQASACSFGSTVTSQNGSVDEMQSDVEATSPTLPTEFSMSPNYPNPFNPSTTIKVAMPEAGAVRMTVFNILGQKVATLMDGVVQAGYHQVVWNAVNDYGQPLASGIYIYRIEVKLSSSDKPIVQSHKMLLMK